MTENKTEKHGFDAFFIIDIALKYKIHLIVVGVVSVLLSTIFSSEYFIKPRFKSTAIVYPSNLVPYSTESPTEQMLQLFGSDDIRDELIEDFKLFDHYQVDLKQKYPLTTLYGMMSQNITYEKTKFESVELTVWDTDPMIASRMIDSLLSKMHKKARQLQRAKSAEVVVILKNQFLLKKHEMDSMENELMRIRNDYGILDFETQVESFTRVYYDEVANGRAGQGADRPMDKIMHNLLSKGGDYIALKEHLWRTRGSYNDYKVLYEQALKDLTKQLTYTNIVTNPVPAEKKSYPVRSVIILMFTGSMLLLSFIILVIYENAQRMEYNKSI